MPLKQPTSQEGTSSFKLKNHLRSVILRLLFANYLHTYTSCWCLCVCARERALGLCDKLRTFLFFLSYCLLASGESQDDEICQIQNPGFRNALPRRLEERTSQAATTHEAQLPQCPLWLFPWQPVGAWSILESPAQLLQKPQGFPN